MSRCSTFSPRRRPSRTSGSSLYKQENAADCLIAGSLPLLSTPTWPIPTRSRDFSEAYRETMGRHGTACSHLPTSSPRRTLTRAAAALGGRPHAPDHRAGPRSLPEAGAAGGGRIARQRAFLCGRRQGDAAHPHQLRGAAGRGEAGRRRCGARWRSCWAPSSPVPLCHEGRAGAGGQVLAVLPISRHGERGSRAKRSQAPPLHLLEEARGRLLH
jgi:hypothetical protein